MKPFTKTALFAATTFLLAGCFGAAPHTSGEQHVKNVIFMVPDGMGLADVTAARNYRYGTGGGVLSFEHLPFVAYQQTYSLDSLVTDSAAASSAWASGEKFPNGAISCMDLSPADGVCDGSRKHPRTLLEQAKDAGKSTGLVVTSDITHATPAAWGAHAPHRKCETAIFQNYLENRIDVMLGGGIATNRGPCKLAPTTPEENQALVEKAQGMGYRLVQDKEALAAASAEGRLLGLFKEGGLTPVYLRGPENSEPTLPEMVTAALTRLEQNPKGFLLLIEGSQVDWGNHNNDIKWQIGETLAFADAFSAVKRWMEAKPGRDRETLVIIVADHETGGFAVNGPKGRYAKAGDTDVPYRYKGCTYESDQCEVHENIRDEAGNVVMSPDLEPAWTSPKHTAVDTIIWSNQPNIIGVRENTALFGVIQKAMR